MSSFFDILDWISCLLVPFVFLLFLSLRHKARLSYWLLSLRLFVANVRYAIILFRRHDYKDAYDILFCRDNDEFVATNSEDILQDDDDNAKKGNQIPVYNLGIPSGFVVLESSLPQQLPAPKILENETELQSLRRAYKPGLSMREIARRANRPGINKDNVKSKLKYYGIV